VERRVTQQSATFEARTGLPACGVQVALDPRLRT